MFGGGHGAVAVFDEHDQQVPEWQGSLLCEHLAKMRDAGVITPDTPVEVVLPGVPAQFTTAATWIPFNGEECTCRDPQCGHGARAHGARGRCVVCERDCWV